MSQRFRSIGVVLVTALLCAVSSQLAAQPAAQPAANASKTSPSDRAAAQVLFDEGRALLAKKQYEKACRKFAESQRLDPATGTQLNLAACYEKIGKTASAWINFIEAAAAAKKQGNAKRTKVATDRAKKLEPKLSRIRIVVAKPVAGLKVKRGEAVVRDAQWGTAVPVDPGPYQISASAPEKKTWSKKVRVSEPGTVVDVKIPPLEAAPSSEVEPPPEPPPKSTAGTTQKIIAAASAGVGLAGLIVGIAYGVRAMNKNDDSLAYCPDDPNRCTAEGVDLRDQALSSGTISTVGFVVGPALLATGLALWFTAPASAEQSETDAAGAEQSAQIEVLPKVDFGWNSPCPPNAGRVAGSVGVLVRGRW